MLVLDSVVIESRPASTCAPKKHHIFRLILATAATVYNNKLGIRKKAPNDGEDEPGASWLAGLPIPLISFAAWRKASPRGGFWWGGEGTELSVWLQERLQNEGYSFSIPPHLALVAGWSDEKDRPFDVRVCVYRVRSSVKEGGC